MRVDLFDYDLPEELIAQEPAPERTASRMMVLDRAARTVEHRRFTDLPAYLRPGDCLVLNDTRVIAARLHGRRAMGGEVEILLLRPREPLVWQALARPARRVRVGESLEFGPGLRATVTAAGEEGLRELAFEVDGSFDDLVARLGEPPLPPYVRRKPRPEDRERYQTVYARHRGAVAAPTAGLHFDAPMLSRLQSEGVDLAYLTLHVGLGTFRPVTVDNAEDHVMHAEAYHVSAEAAAVINRARAAGGRIVAVGTTVVRTLETVAAADGTIPAAEGETSLFITPGYAFRAVDALLTNFHLPRSTLLMMVSALAGRPLGAAAGREFILDAYRQAIAERYRFFSYGDCMLIL